VNTLKKQAVKEKLAAASKNYNDPCMSSSYLCDTISLLLEYDVQPDDIRAAKVEVLREFKRRWQSSAPGILTPEIVNQMLAELGETL
jgi:hypothetical protein